MQALFERPLASLYTVGLLGSVPRLYSSLATEPGDDGGDLREIPGIVPSMREAIDGMRVRAAVPARDGALPARGACARGEAPEGQSAACWESGRLEMEHAA